MKTTATAVTRWSIAATLLALAAAACAEPPTAEMEAAYRMQDEAVAAGASDYAPAAMERVFNYRAELENELAIQGERWSIRRNYDRARALTDSLGQATTLASQEAETGRQAAAEEAGRLIADARIALEATQAAIAVAPAGKGSAADLAMLRAEVETAAQTLVLAETAFAEEDYLDARARAMAAMEALQRVRGSVDTAREIIG